MGRERRARVVLLGFGAINRHVAAMLRSRPSATTIVGVVVRNAAALTQDLLGDAALITQPEDLLPLAPDIILEAASREAVRQWGDVALRAAPRVVISSTSAFADDELLAQFRATARQSGSQLVLSPGALAGMDALSAAARQGLREVRHRIIKPPASWGAVAAQALPSAAVAPVVLFAGTAREAARLYPLNANVTIVSALSGIGPDATAVELIADPSAVANRHEIHATGEFGTLTVRLENRPLPSNPKSSMLAALALARLAENEVADLVL